MEAQKAIAQAIVASMTQSQRDAAVGLFEKNPFGIPGDTPEDRIGTYFWEQLPDSSQNLLLSIYRMGQDNAEDFSWQQAAQLNYNVVVLEARLRETIISRNHYKEKSDRLRKELYDLRGEKMQVAFYITDHFSSALAMQTQGCAMRSMSAQSGAIDPNVIKYGAPAPAPPKGFRVGDWVICVDNRPHLASHIHQRLKKGAKYQVEEIKSTGALVLCGVGATGWTQSRFIPAESPTKFQVGDQVVCIDNTPILIGDNGETTTPAKYIAYTVQKVIGDSIQIDSDARRWVTWRADRFVKAPETIKGWLELIEDEEIREKALREHKRFGSFALRPFKSVGDAIASAFPVRLTPEGYQYWINIAQQYS